jgi:hypothetical protein
MTDQSSGIRPAFFPDAAGQDRPRIALMGEFSAGKSTLANLMIGTDPLPMQVVATQLPPVWISYGSEPSVVVSVDGEETPCDLSTVQAAKTEDIAYIRFQCDEDILQRCDIIDMPGISDPNMSSEVWQRLLPVVDAVIWCSPSTQAWRQSEAAVWDSIDDCVRQNSMLLLTRADMLLTERDRSKVLKRVQRETEGLFAKVQMISLLEAREAEDKEEVWRRSGAEEFVKDFMHLLDVMSGHARDGTTHQDDASPNRAPASLDLEPGIASDGGPQPRRVVRAGKSDTKTKRATGPEAFTPKFS